MVCILYSPHLVVVYRCSSSCVVFCYSCGRESEPQSLSVGSEYRLHALFGSGKHVLFEWRLLCGEMQYAVAYGRNPDVTVFAHNQVVAEVCAIVCYVL